MQFESPITVALSVYAPMVRAYDSLGDPDSAQEARDIAAGMVSPPLDQFLAFNEADIQIERGDLERAESAVQRGVAIIDKFKYQDLMFLVEMTEGYVKRSKGDYQGSSTAFRSALDYINRSVRGEFESYQQLPCMYAELAES